MTESTVLEKSQIEEKLIQEEIDLILFNTRSAWDLPERITVSEWSDQHRVLPEISSAEPGKWRTDRTPYLRGPMDAFNDPHIRSIVFMASSQVGKTENMLNMLGYVIDQDPAPALWVSTTEELVKEFFKERIKPMIESSDTLRDQLTEKSDDLTKRGARFKRMSLYTGWATSPSSLASRPIKYVFLDECDKYPKFSGNEADPIDLSEERTKTFWNHKIIKCSTPTTRQGYIYQEYQKTDRQQYYVPCPHCGTYQPLVWSQVKFPKEVRDPIQIREERLAYYECISCKQKISDVMKQKMLMKGVWVPEGKKVDKNGNIKGKIKKVSRVGFWINVLYSPWNTFSDVVAKFLESKDEVGKLMNFINSWLAEPFEEKAKSNSEDAIRTLICPAQEEIVPESALVLTAGCDVQQDHFYYEINAWGYGQESWMIKCGRLENWSDVIYELIEREYTYHNGRKVFIRMTCIDSGGHNTSEVYEVCRRYPDRMRAIKGNTRMGGIPYKASVLDRWPDGKVMKGGISLWHVDVNYFKDKVYRLSHSADDIPALWNLHENTPDEYIKQFCSEDKVYVIDKKSGRHSEMWKKRYRNIANHYWDCAVYATAAAEMIGVPSLRQADQQSSQNQSTDKNKEKKGFVSSVRSDGKGWLNR